MLEYNLAVSIFIAIENLSFYLNFEKAVLSCGA